MGGLAVTMRVRPLPPPFPPLRATFSTCRAGALLGAPPWVYGGLEGGRGSFVSESWSEWRLDLRLVLRRAARSSFVICIYVRPSHFACGPITPLLQCALGLL